MFNITGYSWVVRKTVIYWFCLGKTKKNGHCIRQLRSEIVGFPLFVQMIDFEGISNTLAWTGFKTYNTGRLMWPSTNFVFTPLALESSTDCPAEINSWRCWEKKFKRFSWVGSAWKPSLRVCRDQYLILLAKKFKRFFWVGSAWKPSLRVSFFKGPLLPFYPSS